LNKSPICKRIYHLRTGGFKGKRAVSAVSLIIKTIDKEGITDTRPLPTIHHQSIKVLIAVAHDAGK
jgi:hypothetical protein